MKYIMQKVRSRLPVFIGLTLIWGFNNLLILETQKYAETDVRSSYLVSVINAGMVGLTWFFLRHIILYSRHRFAGQKRSTRHNWFLLLWMVSLPIIYVALLFIGDVSGLWRNYFSYNLENDEISATTLLLLLTSNFVCFIGVALLDERLYSMERQRKYEQRIEKLEQENLQTQLDLLKSQINPHFLFNSLNTLSELVMDNPRAEAFVDKLASVYRYLLQSNHDVLCPLENELKFIKAYFHLLETRHSNSVRMELSIGPEFLKWQLPPLTLKLLVENAVKHNAVSEGSPLVIRLFTEGENLVVENNVQRKAIAVPSNKVGLSNIAKKYQLLGGKQVEVVSDEQRFRVVLPLINPLAAK